MAKRDYGRFNYRGVPNARITVGTATPLEARRNDIWVYPGAGTGKYYIKKASSETVTSSTTLQNDDDIVFNLPEPGTYSIKALLTAAGATNGDIKIDWVASSGATQLTTRRCLGPAVGASDSTSASMRCSAHNLTTAVSYGTNESTVSVILEEFLVTTSATGTVQMRWAQNASSATATTLSNNSYATIEQLKGALTAGISYYTGSAWAAAAF